MTRCESRDPSSAAKASPGEIMKHGMEFCCKTEINGTACQYDFAIILSKTRHLPAGGVQRKLRGRQRGYIHEPETREIWVLSSGWPGGVLRGGRAGPGPGIVRQGGRRRQDCHSRKS